MLTRMDPVKKAAMKSTFGHNHIFYVKPDEWYRSDDEEDETAELMRELEKIKRERAEQRAKEVCILFHRHTDHL
jgi:hypothetical protein